VKVAGNRYIPLAPRPSSAAVGIGFDSTGLHGQQGTRPCIVRQPYAAGCTSHSLLLRPRRRCRWLAKAPENCYLWFWTRPALLPSDRDFSGGLRWQRGTRPCFVGRRATPAERVHFPGDKCAAAGAIQNLGCVRNDLIAWRLQKRARASILVSASRPSSAAVGIGVKLRRSALATGHPALHCAVGSEPHRGAHSSHPSARAAAVKPPGVYGFTRRKGGMDRADFASVCSGAGIIVGMNSRPAATSASSSAV
jgi:hypothetical protein